MSTITSEITSITAAIGRDEITFETGKLAKQADGAVVMRSGDTMVLATAQGRPEAREGADFFPLTVDVEERMYAAGKIPGGFFKREGRPTEKAILTARMIDRPIRPLWPKGFRNEVQVICTTLSADLITPHDILAINGASAALMISPLPFFGPVGAVRIGIFDGEMVVNPSLPDIGESELDLIVVGTKEGLTMVEAGANEVAEDTLLEALELAHAEIKKLCEAQEELRSRAGKPKWLDPELTEELDAAHGEQISARILSDGLRAAASLRVDIAEELGADRVDAGSQQPRRHPRAPPVSRPSPVPSASSSRATSAPSRMPSRIRRRSAPRSASSSSTASSRRSSFRSRSAPQPPKAMRRPSWTASPAPTSRRPRRRSTRI